MAFSAIRALRVQFMQVTSWRLLEPCQNLGQININLVRHSKHWNPKFKWLRKMKVIKVDLPNFEEEDKDYDMSPEEMRSKLKEKGIEPPRVWMERPFYISCTGAIFEPYIPPEGDGKVSAISLPGAKQRVELVGKKGKSMMAIRKIKSYDEDWEMNEFLQEAQDIYINSYKAMISKDENKLREFVTERAYPETKHNILDKTIHWKFIKSLEPPRLVHARCTELITKENIFAQVTVRFHTQQILAIYDRFGRLMHGNEILAKDVLEYIVFEKHIANQYGVWRVHDKIIPDWMPSKEPAHRTYKITKVEAKDDNEKEKSEDGEIVVTQHKQEPPSVAL